MLENSKKNLRVPYALAVHGKEERRRVLAVLDEHRTNVGIETKSFEKRVARYFGKKYGVMVNSGSSANLLAFELLNLPQGSEIITPILTFSTTISPLIKKGLIPSFTDVGEGTYIIDLGQIENLINRKTKAILVPLLLGNAPDMKRIRSIAKKYKLYVIEDSCDTLGATFDGEPTGVYTDIITTSFFGSHIITTGGGGGMIMVNDEGLRKRALMLRGWGRTSALFGETEDIEKRFSTRIDNIPYDAKFLFEEIGYNFLPVEMAAAFGNAQVDKLSKFRRTREYNFDYLLSFFARYRDFFILPKQDRRVKTQWLAFPLTIKKNAPFTRLELVKFLEEHNIQTRPIFTGNILKQPGFRSITHKVVQKGYPMTDAIMERGFVIGCHQGLTKRHLEKIERVFIAFLDKYL